MSVREGVNAPSIMPSGRPMSYLSVDTNPNMFGAGVGRAIENLGGTIMSVDATLDANAEKLRKEQAALNANQAFVTSVLAAGQAEAEFMSTTGLNTMNAYGPYVERLKAIRTEALDSLGDDESKKLYDEASQATFLSGINGGASYVAKQKLVAASDAAKARIEIVMNDSRTKFSDDNLFQANLNAIDRTQEQLGAILGWDEVTILNEQVKQRSLAWEYRITAMSLGNPEGAAKLFNSVRDGLASDARLRIEKDLNGALWNRAGEGFIMDLTSGKRTATGTTFTTAATYAVLPANVQVGIIDRTTIKNMTPRAWAILHGAAARAAELGVTLRITAGGGPGHKSHGGNTEWDLVGFQADGSQWNTQQRAYIAEGGRMSGADRFGLYPGGSLHIGYSGDGRPAAFWGAGGATSAAAGGRNFRDPYDAAFAGSGAPPVVPAAGRMPVVGSLRDRIIGAESGWRTGVTSHKGASGIMQIMPDTAAMVAQQLGIPFDPWRLQYDADYNMLIGETYLNQLLDKYDGNETLAAAAYNGGPGRVDRWIAQFGDPRSGTITNEQWAALIPITETREYVAKVMSGAPAGGVTTTIPPLTGRTSPESYEYYRNQALAWAESVKPGDPDFAAAVVSKLDTWYNREKKIETEADQENYDTILGAATTPRPDGSLPTTEAEIINSAEMKERWNNLDNGQRDAIRQRLKGNVVADTGPTAEQLRHYEMIAGMAKLDWPAFVKHDIAGDKELHPKHQEELVKLRLGGPEAAVEPTDVDLAQALSRADPILKSLQIDAETDRNKYEQFVGALSITLRQQTETKGQKLTQDEVWKSVSWLLQTNQLYIEDHWWYGKQVAGAPTYQTIKLPFDDDAYMQPAIPPEIAAKFIEDFTRITGSAPTDADIQDYWQKKMINDMMAPEIPQ